MKLQSLWVVSAFLPAMLLACSNSKPQKSDHDAGGGSSSGGTSGGGGGATSGGTGGVAGASGGTAGASGGTAGASGGTAGASGGTAGASGGTAGASGGSGGSSNPATVNGTLAVTDLTVVDSAATVVASGQQITVDFQDLTDAKGGVIVAGTTTTNGCVVTRFDATHLPHASLDVGPITIANSPAAESPATGLLATVGPCAFGGGRYLCGSNAATNATVTATDLANNPPSQPPGLISYAFPASSSVATGKLAGSYLLINGFTSTVFNSGQGAFPVVSQNNQTLVAFDPAAEGAAQETANGTVSYTLLNGVGPVPVAGVSFLGTGSISVNKTANGVWPAINATLDVPGKGWTLSDAGYPSTLPLTGTASDVVFGCGNNTPSNPSDDTCGDASTTQVQMMVISGRATRKDVSTLAKFQMPTEVPGTDTWLEFRCAYIGTHSATLPREAGQAIIDFAPTRVEVRVNQAAAVTLADGINDAVLLAGHAFVGHTDHP